MYRLISSIFTSLRQFVYPARCFLCDTHLNAIDEEMRCRACATSTRRLGADFNAPRLAHAWFDRARSLYPFEGRVRDVLHGLKYEQRFDLVRPLARALADEARRLFEVDCVMPVPLHPWRLASRGYNQAALLAHPVARDIGVPLELHALTRIRSTKPQVGRELEERLKAVKGAFAVRDAHAVEKRSILLIDDVLTSGATANECARTLKKAGARRVVVLTVARPL